MQQLDLLLLIIIAFSGLMDYMVHSLDAGVKKTCPVLDFMDRYSAWVYLTLLFVVSIIQNPVYKKLALVSIVCLALAMTFLRIKFNKQAVNELFLQILLKMLRVRVPILQRSQLRVNHRKTRL